MKFSSTTRLIRSSLLGLLLAVATVPTVQAQPASAESIETLLALTKAETIIEASYQQAEQIMRQTMSQELGRTPTPEEQQAFESFTVKFMAAMRDEFSWAKLKPHYVELYRSTFVQDEIDGLLAFYRSPVGQAFVDKMPVVMQKTTLLVQERFQALAPRMKQAIEESLKSIKRRG